MDSLLEWQSRQEQGEGGGEGDGLVGQNGGRAMKTGGVNIRACGIFVESFNV